jgi:hypothetical protein
MTMYHLCLEELDELFGAIGPLEFREPGPRQLNSK